MSFNTGISDSGSNYRFTDKTMPPVVRSSQFDLSYINTLTAKQGALIPVMFSYYYPGDSFQVSLESLIRVVNPPVVPLASRQRVFFHLFSMDYSQLWYYWDAMARKGYSGTFEATLPTVSAKLATLVPDTQDQYEINPLLARGSLADYLGFNFSDYTYKAGDEHIDIKLPALPFLFYQRVFRDYYLNKNLSIDDSVLLPEIDQDLLIQGKSPLNLTLDGSSQQTDEPLNKLPFGKLRYRNYADDYFTTALPWPMRGDVPTIDLESSDTVLGIRTPDGNTLPIFMNGWADTMGHFSSSLLSADGELAVFNKGAFPASNESYLGGFSTGAETTIDYGQTGIAASVGSYPLTLNNNALTITQPTLKLLWTNTLINEKLARTDGTYGSFIKTFFGTSPRHWVDHRAQYHGGTYQPIVYSQVLQTAPADTGTVGSVYGQGISSSSGYVGSLNASDFGMTMVLMSILPDTYYCQGWNKEHLYQTQDDLPLPERAMLGMQPVTQAEIFFNAHDSTGEDNQKLFGYQSRFDELRYRQNEIHGDVANPNSLSYFPYTQARYFENAPNLNNEFVTTENNIRNDFLSAPNEVPFMVQVANRINAVRPYPYIAPPSAIMM